MSHLIDNPRQTSYVVSPAPSSFVFLLFAHFHSFSSKVCGHSFSSSAIRDFLGPNHTRKQKCPASGCTRQICFNDLEPDNKLEKRVKAAGKAAAKSRRGMRTVMVVKLSNDLLGIIKRGIIARDHN